VDDFPAPIFLSLRLGEIPSSHASRNPGFAPSSSGIAASHARSPAAVEIFRSPVLGLLVTLVARLAEVAANHQA